MTIRQAVDQRKAQMIAEKHQKNLFILALVVIVLVLGYRDMILREQLAERTAQYEKMHTIATEYSAILGE